MTAPDLSRFFAPSVVAVVGASDSPGKPNTGIWTKLRDWAERVGAVAHPVNPGRATVDRRTSYASLLDVPDDVDVAALLVGDPLPALEQAVEKKAKFAVVFASGFAELGVEGAAAQQKLADVVAGTDTRLIGPNTNLNAFEEFRTDLDGKAIALISQSGHQGRPIFQMQELGVRLSHWAPTGNEADLEFADFAEWFAEQPDIGAIAAYVEGFKDGRSFLRAARAAAEHRTPIVCVKVGRTDEGASMASSHTGKLTGSDAVISAAMAQSGVIRVRELDELAETSMLLARAQPPQADGVCVVAISGGTGAHMADLCGEAGLHLPTLSAETQETLYQWIPRYLRVSNPVDNGGHPVGDERGRMILDTLLADASVGALVCPITGAFPPMSDRLAQDLVDVAETTDKPVCVVWGSPVGLEPAYRDILLSSSKVAVFRTFGNCVTALRAYFDWHEFLVREDTDVPVPARDAAPLAATRLSEWDAKQVVRSYGITTPDESLAASADEAVAAAERIGYPVVVKACSPDLLHKTELGLVRLGVADAAAVRAAYDDVVARAPGTLQGVLVGEMVTGGVEAIVGAAPDPLFGRVVMVGLGGVLVEVLGDVAFGVPPFSRAHAVRMVRSLRGYRLLTGVRGRPPADVDALVDAVMSLQQLVLDHAEIRELDLNPVVVLPRGAVALDALIRI